MFVLCDLVVYLVRDLGLSRDAAFSELNQCRSWSPLTLSQEHPVEFLILVKVNPPLSHQQFAWRSLKTSPDDDPSFYPPCRAARLRYNGPPH